MDNPLRSAARTLRRDVGLVGAEVGGEDALFMVLVEVCDVCERAMKKAGVEKRKRLTVLNAVDSHLDRELR